MNRFLAWTATAGIVGIFLIQLVTQVIDPLLAQKDVADRQRAAVCEELLARHADWVAQGCGK